MEKLNQFILHHSLLWLALIAILLLIFINEWLSNKKKAKELSPQELVNKINNEDVVVVDIRDQESYNKAHIIHAIQAKPEAFERGHMNKYKDKTVILVCTRGLQAASLASKLQKDGFQCLVLSGGITAWQQADLPLVKGKN